MKIGVLKEIVSGEARVAATPETVKKMIALSHSVSIEAGAGIQASFSDADYKNNGAEIVSRNLALQSDLLLMVRPLDEKEVITLKPKQFMVGMLEPFNNDLQTLLKKTRRISFCIRSLTKKYKSTIYGCSIVTS